MEKIIIRGGNQLHGDVEIDGMKNAALPIIYACILTRDKCRIENCPNVSDVKKSLEILKAMGATVKFENKHTVIIDTKHLSFGSSPYSLVTKIRASTYLVGAELGRFHKAKVGLPGGCDFGIRPIDQHIKGFQALGATIAVDDYESDVPEKYIYASADEGLLGNSIYFDMASVGATVNVMLAAVLAEGMTIIDNAAREPHIVDLANFLNTCGANITGAGTSVIKIRGVSKLHGCTYTIIPDMIEAGTFMAAAAATGGTVNIRNIIPKHMETVSAKLTEMGVIIQDYDDYLTVTSNGNLRATMVKTQPYPGFPTDMHPQFSSLLAVAHGKSTVNENVWETRFKYVAELQKMGADISIDGRTATIQGVDRLHGAEVKAVDLRAGAAMIIAGLVADGETVVTGIEYIERGYYDIVGKFKRLGADIQKITE